MYLLFSVDDMTRLLVSLSYQPSDGDVELDSIYSIQEGAACDSDDDNIQVIACYSEIAEFRHS